MPLPASSPRLPSPPPPAEIQIGPQSPAGGPPMSRQTSEMEMAILESNSKRRIHPGSKAADMAAGPPLMSLNELDSAFQLQEHLAALHYHHTERNTRPVTRETANLLATPPQSTDRTLWLYELCRFLTAQCNSLIVGFLFDNPPCSATTCPEMRASEWQFLCAVHEQPKSCCAIDYCCHTLDWAANVVTDQKIFPSRFVAQSDAHNKSIAAKNLVNVFRRLHRIFAHAWFQHRGVYWSVEGQTGLYVFFKTVCDEFDLLPGETYKLPLEAESLEPQDSIASTGSDDKKATMNGTPSTQSPPQRAGDLLGSDDFNLQSSRTNTRRHIRSSPSTGSAVTTVMEQDEEDGGDHAGQGRAIPISTSPELFDEPEIAEVPVIVEGGVMPHAPSPPLEKRSANRDVAEKLVAEVPEKTGPVDANIQGGPGEASEGGATEVSTAKSQASTTNTNTNEVTVETVETVEEKELEKESEQPVEEGPHDGSKLSDVETAMQVLTISEETEAQAKETKPKGDRTEEVKEDSAPVAESDATEQESPAAKSAEEPIKESPKEPTKEEDSAKITDTSAEPISNEDSAKETEDKGKTESKEEK